MIESTVTASIFFYCRYQTFLIDRLLPKLLPAMTLDPHETTVDTIEFPGELDLELLLKPLLGLIGPDNRDSIVAMVNLLPGEWLAAPSESLARLNDDIEKLLDQRDIEPLVQPFVVEMAQVLDKFNGSARSNSALLGDGAGAELLAYLERIRDDVGLPEFIRCLRATNGLFSLTLLSGFLATSVTLDTPNQGERIARSMASACHKAAEVTYKPLLAALLSLTRLWKGHSGAEVPTMLGKLDSHCRDAWKNGAGPVAILQRELLLLRNAVAHHDIEYDVTKGSILFKHGNLGLGPWSNEELRRNVEHFVQRIFLIAWAVLVVVVTPVCDALAARDWKLAEGVPLLAL